MLPLSENALDELVARERDRGAPPLTDWVSLSRNASRRGFDSAIAISGPAHFDDDGCRLRPLWSSQPEERRRAGSLPAPRCCRSAGADSCGRQAKLLRPASQVSQASGAISRRIPRLGGFIAIQVGRTKRGKFSIAPAKNTSAPPHTCRRTTPKRRCPRIRRSIARVSQRSTT